MNMKDVRAKADSDAAELRAELEAPLRALLDKVAREFPELAAGLGYSRAVASLLASGNAFNRDAISLVARRAQVERAGKVVWLADDGALNRHTRKAFEAHLGRYAGSLAMPLLDAAMPMLLHVLARWAHPDSSATPARAAKARAAICAQWGQAAMGDLVYGWLSRNRQAVAFTIRDDHVAGDGFVYFPKPNQAVALRPYQLATRE